jgi:hypothetical protein
MLRVLFYGIDENYIKIANLKNDLNALGLSLDALETSKSLIISIVGR